MKGILLGCKARLAGALAATLLGLCPAVAMAAPSLFEGLEWGADEARIRQVLGERVGNLPCTDEQRQAQAASGKGRACDSPYLEDYTIDGITFLAVFNMGGDAGTLNGIYLDRAATVTNAQIRKGEGAEFRYNRVKRVLTDRHGPPADLNETTRRPKDTPVVLHAKWIVQDTVVSMTNTIIPDPRGQMYYLGLVYKPLAEAMKPVDMP
ncbi:hypothetical protein [Stenotrophomonas sp. SY1]|uniref:hypothetical protein n=1 Tax=Stenotrophomonas sp. SY1 TaxID=477235 RepID=UPI001E348204|nr:hypothetical protein [Stenotrophomonas sp. SY1]MCD9085225.1 hypothetical protein [Stenotrophomonas sp. SY1]